MKYFAFCDPSGGSSDSMTLAIARTSILGKKAVLVAAVERKAPFNPDAVTQNFAEILKSYRLTTVTGDRYSAEWVIERFRAHGITYLVSEKTKSEIYLDFLAAANSDRIRIPNNKRLRAQLVSLERRVSRSGRDAVDHPPSGHDDLSNAVCGALCLAAVQRVRTFFEPFVMDVRVGRTDFPSGDADPNGDPYDPAVNLPWDNWRKLN